MAKSKLYEFQLYMESLADTMHPELNAHRLVEMKYLEIIDEPLAPDDIMFLKQREGLLQHEEMLLHYRKLIENLKDAHIRMRKGKFSLVS